MMITVEELKTQLESRYDLKSFIDLATLTSTPQAAYQFFNQHLINFFFNIFNQFFHLLFYFEYH